MGSGLFHTLNIGSEALYATRQGVDTAGHNIANAQTEGYSRQRVNIKQRDPLLTHGVLIGNGVYVGSIDRAHDKFIENQLNKALQESGRASARSDAMQQLQGVFSPESHASVADEVTKFFSSLETLASFPADATVRTSVVEAGKDVASAFQRVDTELKANRASLNERIAQICGETTDDLQQIANLNIKIQVAEAGEGQQANDMRDQREKLVRKISNQVEVKYYEDKNGMLSVRGPNQVTLVDAGHSCKLGVARDGDNDGLSKITITDWEDHNTRDVTQKMDGGALQALVEIRDKDVPGLMTKNNEMAYAFANSVNAEHREGFGLNEFAEKAGRNFFATPKDIATAAEGLQLDDAITASANAISAASSPQAPGDNINLNRLIKLRDANVFPDEKVNFNEYYANYTGALGLNVVRADHIKEANDAVIGDLNQRRESVAGVSLDEEATNMMKWQANFTATSRVIKTVDEMLNTVLELKR